MAKENDDGCLGIVGAFVFGLIFLLVTHWWIAGIICILLSIFGFLALCAESKNDEPITVDNASKVYTAYLSKLKLDYTTVESKLSNLNINIDKLINYHTGEYLIIDNTKKNFYFIATKSTMFDKSKLMEVIEKNELHSLDGFELMLNDPEHHRLYKDYSALNALTSSSLQQNPFIKSEFSYGDLIKVDFTDKTTVDEEKTYTIQGREDEALLGAIIGDMFSTKTVTRFGEFKTDSYAEVGAIIGASGEREVTENVKKTVNCKFEITLYLNNLDCTNLTITIENENLAKEIFATFNYILCNK